MPLRRIGSDQGLTLSFPPFTRAVLWLIGINVCVYFFITILSLSSTTSPFAHYFGLGAVLIPQEVLRGQVWRVISYSFLNGGLQLIINMLQLWMFGAQIEQTWGWRRFTKFYFICVTGAALVTMALSYAKLLGLDPTAKVAGSSGGVLGVLMAFGILFADTEIFMFPFPVLIKAKYMVGILVVVTLIAAMNVSGGISSIAQLGGLLTGFLYIKFWDRRIARRRRAPGVYVGRGLSDRAFEQPPARKPSLLARWRDSYYRWKRRRAARKFEVYMRKHDRKVYFDEHGNYIDPESAEGQRRGEDDSKKPWIN